MIWSGIPSGRHSIFIIYLRIKIFLLTFVVINYKKFTDMKKLLSILLVMALMVGMAACSAKDRLKQDIEQSNKECPTDLGDGLKITKFTYDEGSNECVAHLNFPPGIDVMELSSVEAEMKSGLQEAFSGGDKETREMIDLLADADAGLRFDITSGFNKKTYSISLSAAEIKKLQNK